MLIVNANIKTMEDQDYKNGYILIENGKIKALGDMKGLKYKNDNILDVQGKLVLPGLIDPHCHLGLWEEGLGFEGEDGNEDTDPVTPQLRAIDSINPRDMGFDEALQFGITSVVTGPGSCNPISGMWAAIKTYGTRIDNMIIKDPVGMKFSLGENPKTTYSDKNLSPVTRMATVSIIREQLKKTQEYVSKKEKAMQDPELEIPDYDVKYEALEPVIKGELTAYFHAHRCDDIYTAIRISKEFNLNYVLIHATESHIISDALFEENAKVILGPFLCGRSKPELKELSPKTVSILSKKGILTAVCTDHPEVPIQYLGLKSSVAVKEGLDEDQALRNITINAAKICGIDNVVGSLKVGKDADISVFDESPVSGYVKAAHVIVSGHKVF